MRTREGLAECGFREWAESSSEEAALGGIAGRSERSKFGWIRQGAWFTGRGPSGKTERLIVTVRLDLEAERTSRSCAWSNLEPLKES